MTKEYLEALEEMCCATLEEDLSVRDIYENEYDIVKKTLQRLESIDNANPSEALKSLKIIGNCWLFGETDVKKAYSEQYDTIEQYILKAQELKSVLEKYNIKSIEELEKILKS